MTTELYVNAPAGTTALAAPMGAADTTVTLGSQPTTATGQFRLLVDAELILLASPPSGTVYAVQGGLSGRGIEGTIAASHASGVAATVVFTAAAVAGVAAAATAALAAAATALAAANAAVASVSGSAPLASSGGTTPTISIAAATDSSAGSMSASDKTKLDSLSTSSWPYNTTIPGSIAAPVLSQAQDTTGTTPDITFQTAAAKTGSGNAGGSAHFVGGAGDGLSGFPSATQGFHFTLNTAVNGSTAYELAYLKYGGAGVAILTLGGGQNGVGGGVAAVEISCYSELSIATEGGVINMFAINDPFNLNAGYFLQPCVTDGTNEAGFALTVDIHHPTSGDASCFQALAVESGSFGTGTLRYYDAQLGGVRRFSVIEQNGYAAVACYDHAGNRSYQEADYVATTTATTAGQTIALVPLPAGVNQVHWTLTAWDTTGTNFATFEIVTAYLANGTTTITSPSAAATITDTGHTAGAGTSIAVTLVPTVSGGETNLAVNVTPWTTNSVHWALHVVSPINTGVA